MAASSRTVSLLVVYLILLLHLLISGHATTSSPIAHRKHHRRRIALGEERKRRSDDDDSDEVPGSFQFTSHQYNLTIPENSIAGVLARPISEESSIKMGIHVPRGYHQVSFKIVEGDDQRRFTATAKKLANFAFLHIELTSMEAVLNREMQPAFQLLVKATAKRRRFHALEASTVVNLSISDENDNAPMFSKTEYSVQADTNTPQNSKLVKLEGFDADEGLNGELYFMPAPPIKGGTASTLSPDSVWSLFYVETQTGWIKTLAPLLHPGNYTMEFLIGDRASRLSFHHANRLRGPTAIDQGEDDENGGISQHQLAPVSAGPRTKAVVRVEVVPLLSARKALESGFELAVDVLPQAVPPFYSSRSEPQVIAILRLTDYLKLPFTLCDELSLELDSVIPAGPVPSALSEVTFATPQQAINSTEAEAPQLQFRLTRRTDAAMEFELVLEVLNGTGYWRMPLYLLPSLELHVSLGEKNDPNWRQQRVPRPPPLLQQTVHLNASFEERQLWFSDEVVELRVNESTPIGYVVWRFEAKTSYPAADGGHVRYRLRRLQNTTKLPRDAPFPFELDEETGVLWLKHQPAPAPASYKVKVSALIMDPHTPYSHRSRINRELLIVITDSNDHCPEFITSSLPANLSLAIRHSGNAWENPIFRPLVVDRDVGENAKILFKLLGINGSEDFFGIDAHTGELRVITPLPNITTSWRVRVLAMDRGWPLTQQTELLLDMVVNKQTLGTVLPSKPAHPANSCELVNREAPTFDTTDGDIVWEIEEAEAVGTIIGTVKATDADLGYNGLIQYTLAEPFTRDAAPFGVGLLSGEIFLRSPLTGLMQRRRASLHNPLLVDVVEVKLEVVARDSAINSTESRAARRAVKLRIHSSNTHSPLFDKAHYRIRVQENNRPGMELLTLHAEDFDLGRNGQVEYGLAIDTAHMLFINPNTGVVKLDRSLDREQRRPAYPVSTSAFITSYDTLVMATDGGRPPKVGFANLTIEVEDVNDEAPICAQNPLKAAILEDAPAGQLVACVHAYDLDEGRNALLNYSIISDGDKDSGFVIEPMGGCIFLTENYFGPKAIRSLIVQVTDNGSPPLSTNCSVEVSVIGAEKSTRQPPQFSHAPAMEASVGENLPAGTTVTRVEAKGTEGAPIAYSFVGGSGLGYFSIDSHTGVIKTSSELDYESSPNYWLTVRATDISTSSPSPRHQLYAHLHLLVSVVNENDHPPMFSQAMYYASVAENSGENEAIVKVEATDLDSAAKGGGVKYAIVRGNPQSNFAIDESTGYVTTGKRRLDREMATEHELVVRACDHGHPQLCSSTLLVVTVEDENDNSPQFLPLGHDQATISADVPAGHVGFLMRLIAMDADAEGPNSRLEYMLLQDDGDGGSEFSIDSQYGGISSLTPLKSGTSRSLGVMVRDRGNPPRHSNITAQLTVVDRAKPKTGASNKKPQLVMKDRWAELFVSDSDQIGTAVGVIKAKDEDGDYLWWELNPLSNPNQLFAIKGVGATSGKREVDAELVLAGSINALDASLASIELQFTVSDGIAIVGDKINIHISRSSHPRRPEFLPQHGVEIELPVTEPPPGYILYSVRTSHTEEASDVSHPHRISYAIHSISELSLQTAIRIDPSLGTIVVEGESNRLLKHNFSLVVSAKLGGKEALSLLRFYRKLTNDNAPRCLFPDQTIHIERGAKEGDIIGQVEAFDPDFGEYGSIHYRIIGGNERGLFMGNESTGEISLSRGQANNSLPQSLTSLLVRASDGAPSPRSTTCSLQIFWEESESAENSPDALHVGIYRESGPDLFQAPLPAAGIGPSGKGPISYSLVQPCPLLEIHFSTGQLYRKKMGNMAANKDQLKGESLNCTVLAELGGDGPKKYIAVSLTVHSTKKAVPQFGMPLYYGAVPENAPKGTVVGPELGISLHHPSKNSDAVAKPPSYRMLPLQNDYFSIDANSGVITTLSPLDHERTKQWEFYVLAHYTSSVLLTELVYTPRPALVIINVTDTNDMAPSFAARPPTFTMVLPPAIEGLELGAVSAIDPDEHGLLRYALRQDSPAQRLFAVDTHSGSLRLATNDTEAFKSKSYELTVIATDAIHTAEGKVRVISRSLDSLALRFNQRVYNISLRENSTHTVQLLSLWPSNARVGENFHFRLLTQHPSFQLGTSTGLLETNASHPVDREISPSIELAVEATSTWDASRRAIASVRVEVEDVNDCAPTFLFPAYSTDISQGVKVGDRLLSVKAVDGDAGQSGVVRYKLEADAPAFVEINKYDARLSIVFPLAATTPGEQFDFGVTAADLGSPPLSSTCRVTLRVVDKDQPIFARPIYTASVSEAAAPGTAVINVRAHGAANNAVLHYEIAGGDPRRHFAIDSHTGLISVSSELDREAQAYYNLTILGVDVTVLQNASSVCKVEIRVENVNDSPPVFEQELYSFAIVESAPEGTLVGMVRATDPDIPASGGGTLYYSIAEGNRSVLALDSASGHIHLASPLDFESRAFYEFVVKCADEDRFATEVLLQLRVLDTNDNPPVFLHNGHLKLTVWSNFSKDTLPIFVHLFTGEDVTDADTISSFPAEKQPFRYAIHQGDQTLFDIDARSGLLTIVRMLEPHEIRDLGTENGSVHSLNISITDGLFTTYAPLRVNLRPAGSAVKLFTFERTIFRASVAENRAPGTPISVVRAEGGQLPIRYRLAGTPIHSPLIAIDEESGKVSLTGRLDGERARTRLVVPLVAIDSAERTAYSVLELEIIDENDHAPAWIVPASGEYSLCYAPYTLWEPNPLAVVLAKDADRGDRLEYSLVPDTDDERDPSKLFDIHPTLGHLRLKNTERPLNEEVADTDVIRLAVRVSDSGNPPHHSDVSVEVKILQNADNNAAVPQFSQFHYLFAIPESFDVGKEFARLLAHEQTTQGFQRVKFSIISEDYKDVFAIDEQNGALSLKKHLDYERQHEHNLVAQIYSGGGSSGGAYSFCIVTISLIDGNDNAPEFTLSYEQGLRAREDTPSGTIVAVYQAEDRDGAGPNSQIRYTLQPRLGEFTIDEEFGWLQVADGGLDRERRNQYDSIRVCASDGLGLETCQNTSIHIIDVNDCAPKFGRPFYQVEVEERDLTNHQAATLLELEPKDCDTTAAQPRLFIMEGNEDRALAIHNRSILVARKGPTLASRLAKIMAFDGRHLAYTTVNVTLMPSRKESISPCLDANLPSLPIEVPSNLPTNDIIHILPNGSAEGKSFIHHLLDSARLPFDLKDNANLVTSEGYYKKPSYLLRIRSREESSGNSCIHHVKVNIQKTNRMAPLMEKEEILITVKENIPVAPGRTHFVLKLAARDDDLGEFGRLSYTIHTSAETKTGNRLTDDPRIISDYFSLAERTGVLSLKRPIDREKRSEFSIPVSIRDGGGLETSVLVRVEVEDVNDNAPVFKQPIYRLKVLENEMIGYQLLKLEAEDADDPTAKITYKWGDDVGVRLKQLVELDEATGALKLVAQLDFEEFKELRLNVVATDDGHPPLFTEALVEVEVLDVNDNSPAFQQSSYQVEMVENTPVGTRILQVVATDRDSEHFGKVSYAIVGATADGHSDGRQYFTLSDDGWLTVLTSIDYEKVKQVHLTVRAMDGGSPSLVDEARVSIRVLDANDNAPEFTTCNMTTIVQEGVPAGQSLLTITLNDADSTSNADVFRLEVSGNGSTSFSVDPLYNLITTRQLSYNEGRQYSLKVRAYDTGGLWSECPLTVFVKQSSKHPPVAKPLVVRLNTLMGEFLGGELGAVHATDKDAADSLRYSIAGPVSSMQAPTNGRFSVDAESGVVHASPDLLTGLYRFNVTVTDGKYTVQSPMTVDVTSVDADATENALSIRLRQLSPEKFVHSHMAQFQQLVSRAAGVPVASAQFLSIQEVAGSDGDLDVLVTVARGESRGYQRPTFTKQRIEAAIHDLEKANNVTILSLTSEMCRRDSCVQGECRDRLWLDNSPSGMRPIQAGSVVFLAPRHLRTIECSCKNGYSGTHCDVPMNMCSKELCMKFETCVPAESEPAGFLCLCAPGSKGARCEEPSCSEATQCSANEELSLLGNGYIRLAVASSVETKLDLTIRFKTLGENGVLMHGQGTHDYHTLQILSGFVEYRWDCGSGEGLARITSPRVDDGNWHEVRVNRRGRLCTIVLDEVHTVEATSPPGSDVVNLYRYASVLTFGATVVESGLLVPRFEELLPKLTTNIPSDAVISHSVRHGRQRESASELQEKIEKGLVGCVGRITLDGYGLSKSEQGVYLHNVAVGCDESRMGPCLKVPCQHKGQCVPNRTENSYTCNCDNRYTGTNCEIDLNVCLSNPCPVGIPCHNLYNDFHCSCPVGFTGKTCNLRGDWDPCVTRPCGPYGICHREGNSFECSCSPGYRGDFCSERVIPHFFDAWPGLNVLEIYTIAAILLIGIILIGIAVFICKRQRRSSPSTLDSMRASRGSSKATQNSSRARRLDKKSEKQDDVCNPLVPKQTQAPALGTNEKPPPPLPPKIGKNGQLYTNLAHFYGASTSQQHSAIPMMEVKPMQQQQVTSSKPAAPPHRRGPTLSCGSSPLDRQSHLGRPPLHKRRTSTEENGGTLGSNSVEPQEARGYSRHRSGYNHNRHASSSATDNEASSDEVLRHFGRKIHRAPHEHPHHHGSHHQHRGGRRSHPARGSFSSIPSVDSPKTGDVGVAVLNGHIYQPSADKTDYMTMRPVHRANPYCVQNEGTRDRVGAASDGDGESGDPPPPPPPSHQRLPSPSASSADPTTKFYDNPNNQNEEEDGTLSNTTSRALDDIDAD